MLINAHAHVFNLQTVLSHQAVKIIGQRVRDRGLPEFVVEAVERLLDELVARPENLDENELLARFVVRIASTNSFKSFVAANLDALPVEIRLLGDGPKKLGTAALRNVLDKLSTALGTTAAGRSSVFDIYETLRIALEADIVTVADHLLGHMGPEDGLVALMMDITAEQEPKRDRANFRAQIRGTSDAAVQRPGRIFPFIAVNSKRADHFDLMRNALEKLGFVGVKLYPSLGYQVDTEPMKQVFDYCVQNDVPIVMHCTRGGFYASQQTQSFGDPAIWEPILKARPTLRICFAHCGGEEGLESAPGTVKPKTWTAEIVKLMELYPNACMDVAYHTGMMSGGVVETNYLATIQALATNPKYQNRILFGTDAWILRLTMADDSFWQYFVAKLPAPVFQQMAGEAPRRFLGLPMADGTGIRPNMQRFVDFIASHRDAVGAEPTPWLRAAAGGTFAVLPSIPGWNPKNHAHFYTYSYALRVMTPADTHLGFPKSADLPLRRLTYWIGGPGSLGFDTRCEGNALKLAAFCKAAGAVYEGEYDDDSAVEQLANVFENRATTLAKLAATVDAMFRFASEDI